MDNQESQYYGKISSQIAEMFNEDCENYINPEDLTDDEKATTFFHVLANLAPAMLYNKLTDQDKDLLSFNYDMNRLICQKTKLEK